MFSASTYTPSSIQPETATILVIEDNQINSEQTKRQLKSANYNVLTASAPDEGWQIIQSSEIQLVVSDLYFNDSSAEALAFFRRIRATPRSAHIPIIISTGTRQRETRQKAMEAGANHYLTKPYPPQDLIAQVRQCLEGNKA